MKNYNAGGPGGWVPPAAAPPPSLRSNSRLYPGVSERLGVEYLSESPRRLVAILIGDSVETPATAGVSFASFRGGF